MSARVYVGDLGSDGSKPELEKEFEQYGSLKSVWIARNPPGETSHGFRGFIRQLKHTSGGQGPNIWYINLQHWLPNTEKTIQSLWGKKIFGRSHNY